MTTLAAALNDLLNNRELELHEAIEHHFTPDYQQRTNGNWDDLTRFAAHMSHLRSIVESARVTVLNELVDGQHYAERHLVEIVKRDGDMVTQEIYAFGEIAHDGRFSRIEEMTLMVSGAEADRDIGTAR